MSPFAWKPHVVLPPAASAPLSEAFFAVTVVPLVVAVAFQASVMLCAPGQFRLTVQLVTGELPAVTSTAPTKPASHELVTGYVAEQPAPTGVGAVVAGVVVDGVPAVVVGPVGVTAPSASATAV